MYVCTGLIALFSHSCATDASADRADTLAPTGIEFRNLDPENYAEEVFKQLASLCEMILKLFVL